MSLMAAGLGWLLGLGLDVPAGGGLALGAALLGGVAAWLAPGTSPLRLAALGLAGLLLGVWRAELNDAAALSGPLSPYRGQVVRLAGEIAAVPRCGAASCQVLLEVRSSRADGLAGPTSGRVLLRTSHSNELSVGRSIVVRGRLVEPRSVLGFPRRELLARQGVFELLEYPAIEYGGLSEPNLFGQLERLRVDLERRISTTIGDPEGPLIAGLLLGREVALAADVRRQLRETGTSHVLAVSGFNVAVVGGALLAGLLPVLGRRWALILAAVAVAGYTLLVGAPPSAVRAAIMFGAAALAGSLGREADALTSLILAAALMAGLDPGVVRELGFQLSVAATAGLVLLSPALTPPAPRPLRWAASALGATLGAQLATLPLTLHTFHSISLVAPLANLVIGPLLPPLMAGGFLTLALSDLPLVVGLVAGPSWLLAHLLLGYIGWAAGLPFASLATGRLPGWSVGLLYAALCTPLMASTVGRRLGWPSPGLRRLVGLAVAGGLCATAVLGASLREVGSDELRATFFDVAGDGLTLVELPHGRRALVGDIGSPLAVGALAEQLPLLDRQLDLVVLTRSLATGQSGLELLLQRYPVGLVLAAPDGGVAELLARRGVPLLTAEPGQLVELDEQVVLRIEAVGARDGQVGGLNASLRVQRLELWLVGAGAVSPTAEADWVVIRLAPELAFGRDDLSRLPGTGSRVVAVGGRTGPGAGGVARFALGGAEVVELATDGERVRLWRRSCTPAASGCEWP